MPDPAPVLTGPLPDPACRPGATNPKGNAGDGAFDDLCVRLHGHDLPPFSIAAMKNARSVKAYAYIGNLRDDHQLRSSGTLSGCNRGLGGLDQDFGNLAQRFPAGVQLR